MLVVQSKKTGPSAVADATSLATVTQLMPGLLEITISSPLKDAIAFQFECAFQLDPATTIQGSAILIGL